MPTIVVVYIATYFSIVQQHQFSILQPTEQVLGCHGGFGLDRRKDGGISQKNKKEKLYFKKSFLMEDSTTHMRIKVAANDTSINCYVLDYKHKQYQTEYT